MAVHWAEHSTKGAVHSAWGYRPFPATPLWPYRPFGSPLLLSLLPLCLGDPGCLSPPKPRPTPSGPWPCYSFWRGSTSLCPADSDGSIILQRSALYAVPDKCPTVCSPHTVHHQALNHIVPVVRASLSTASGQAAIVQEEHDEGIV